MNGVTAKRLILIENIDYYKTEVERLNADLDGVRNANGLLNAEINRAEAEIKQLRKLLSDVLDGDREPAIRYLWACEDRDRKAIEQASAWRRRGGGKLNNE